MSKLKKRDITRARILAAARKVFAKEAYNAASIRTIASEGGFDFGIIRYHFPNKAELFTAVLKEACEDFALKHEEWLKSLNKKRAKENFSSFLDQLLEYHFSHPETFRIIMKNIYMSEDPRFEIPGYEYLTQMFSTMRATFVATFSLTATRDEIHHFSDCFDAQLFMFLGASSYQAALLDLEPESEAYRNWVKDTLMNCFLPHLKQLFSSKKHF